jgi:hypothetical protein
MKDKLGKALDLDRFRTIVDAYGTDPSKWPEAERQAALTLLVSSSDADAVVNDATQLDRMLDHMPVVDPSPELERSIAAIPDSPVSTSNRIGLDSRWTAVHATALWKSAVAATLAVVLGIITGVATVEPSDVSNSSTDWEDFSRLAFVSDWDQELSP